MFSLTKKLPDRDKKHLPSQHSIDNLCIPKVKADSWDALAREIRTQRWNAQSQTKDMINKK